ncbi:MAG TPA: helix-turn-helix domain-containing protein [Chloroflexota bacterium]|jgi:excisionase family DNA binding protein|nr:helix-turn-helix domain-containing protein [Acidimicrobiales bacterium]HJN39335.1 helix-turn-helix domain-containing protein [Chloroflexota bacterium]|tara:strand:- start:194 stop:391 length:198 start_codon:yes stop_codon:yes gene_type:complete
MSDTTQPTDNQLLSVGQLAELLGVPARTIHAWRYRRTAPPGIRLGKHLRFRRSDVEAWIDEHRSH